MIQSAFWTNTIWYILLGIITAAELAYSLLRADQKGRAFAFFATVLGMVLFIETLVLIFFKAYAYYPRILLHVGNPFDDILMGNLFSQFLIAATILLAVLLDLRFYWYILLAFGFAAIEELFLYLGIYEHNWYRTWMTVLLFPGLFVVGKRMYKLLQKGLPRLLYYAYIFLGLFSLSVITIDWIFMVVSVMNMNGTFFGDPISSRMFFAVAQYSTLAGATMFVYFKKPKLLVCSVIFALLLGLYYLADVFLMIHIKQGWFPLAPAICIVWTYASVALLDRLYQSGGSPVSARSARAKQRSSR